MAQDLHANQQPSGSRPAKMSATVYPCSNCGRNIMTEPCEFCGYPDEIDELEKLMDEAPKDRQ